MNFRNPNYLNITKRLASLVMLMGFGSFGGRAQVQENLLPTLAQVGAEAMTAEISPVVAPFAMPKFTRPNFPKLRVEIVPVAADMMATQTIQKAIDQMSERGGGTVIVPKGIWKTGRLVLKTNVNLHVSEGAELHFSGNAEDYQPAVFTRTEGVEVFSLGALIYANGEQNIALSGKGKLVGPPLDSTLRKLKNPMGVDKLDAKKPVAERLYDGHDGGPVFLPVFFGPVNCKDVFVEGVTFEQSALWNIVPQYCDGVIIRGVTVNSEKIPSGDGIDIDSSRNVLIEYCTFSCGDDGVAIKSGRGEDALRVNKPSEYIVMRNCLVLKGHAGISTGSETGGMVRNLYVCDSVFQEPVVGIRFKTRRPRAGGGEHLFYERIRIGKCSTAIAWDMLGEAMFVGGAANRLPAWEVTKLTPFYRDVYINQIQIDNARFGIKAIGLPESLATKILIENVSASTSERAIILNDVEGFVLRNAKMRSANGTLVMLDARTVSFENCHFDVPEGKLKPEVTGELSKDIHFTKCTPEVNR